MWPLILSSLRRALTAAWAIAVVSLIGLAVASHLAALLMIAGSSMEPSIPRGALVHASVVDPALITAGDIVTVKANNGVVITHRVTRALDLPEGRFFELKGDANAVADPDLVPARALMGRVDVAVPYAGYVLALLSAPSGLVFLLAGLGALMVGIWLLEDLEAGTRRAVRQRATARPAHELAA